MGRNFDAGQVLRASGKKVSGFFLWGVGMAQIFAEHPCRVQDDKDRAKVVGDCSDNRAYYTCEGKHHQHKTVAGSQNDILVDYCSGAL